MHNIHFLDELLFSLNGDGLQITLEDDNFLILTFENIELLESYLYNGLPDCDILYLTWFLFS